MANGSVAILYFTNTEQFGRTTAASQYFLQMASFLGIPVIAWNADNAGLESVRTVLQLKRSNRTKRGDFLIPRDQPTEKELRQQVTYS